MKQARMKLIVVVAGLASLAVIAFWESHSVGQRQGFQPPARVGEKSFSRVISAPSVGPFIGTELGVPANEPTWQTQLERAVSEADPMKQSEALQRLADSVARNQIAEVLEWLLKDGRSSAGELRSLLVRRWSQEAPAEAANWALHLPDGEGAHQVFTQIGVVLAQKSLGEAVAWAQELPDGGNKIAALLSVGYEAARSDALMATAMAARMPASAERDELLSFSVRQWAASDPDEALAWARGVSDAALREKLLADVIVAGASQNVFNAASLAASELPSGRNQDDAVVSIVERWAIQSPSQAAAWVDEFPEGRVRSAALENLIELGRATPLCGSDRRQDFKR